MDRVERSYANFKTGTYTGDGTEGQTITGVGFRPKYVEIYSIGAENLEVKLDRDWADWSILHMDYGDDHTATQNRVNSLDTDGFTVDDANNNSVPNTSGTTYYYFAAG